MAQLSEEKKKILNKLDDLDDPIHTDLGVLIASIDWSTLHRQSQTLKDEIRTSTPLCNGLQPATATQLTGLVRLVDDLLELAENHDLWVPPEEEKS